VRTAPLSLRWAALLAVVCAAAGVLTPAPALARAPARATRGLRTARALASGERVRGGRDVSVAMKDIANGYAHLDPAQRRQARRLLARPTDGPTDPQGSGYTVPEAPGSPFCTADFCVHWVASTADAPSLADSDGDGVPDYVETTAAVAQNAHTVENGQLGWREPKGDGGLGGDVDKTDIYLKQLGGTGVFGYTAPDPGQLSPTQTDHSLYSYLVVDNDFAPSEFPGYADPVLPLEVTLAHEYNHVLHFTYDALEDTWLFESTAVWMEDKVYSDVNDYLNYLPGWVQLTSVPLTSFNGNNPNDRANVKVYGSAVWAKYVDQRFGQDAIRNVWERSLSIRPQSFGAGAYDSVLRSHGSSFSDSFSRFAAATAEWQSLPAVFPEGSSYPDVRRAGTLRVGGGPGSIDLDHATFELADVPPTRLARIKLAAAIPHGTAGALALVARRGSGPGSTVTTQLRSLPAGGLGQVVLGSPGSYARITAVLVNADISQSGFSKATGDWRYKRDKQRYVAAASNDFTRPRVVRRSPAPNATGVPRTAGVQIRFSEGVSGLSTSDLELDGPGGHRVPAVLRFHPGSRSAALKPRGRLRANSRYRVRLRAGVTDLALNPLPPQAWFFRTGG
jgi:hypothetical protein